MRGRLEPLPLQRNDALVAAHVGALVDGEGEMALAEQLRGACGALRARGVQLFRIEAGEGAQPVGRVEVDDQHVDDAVAARLELEAAVELQRRAQQRGERGGFADCARDFRRITVIGEQHVERRPQPHEAAAHIERRHGERDDHVVRARV